MKLNNEILVSVLVVTIIFIVLTLFIFFMFYRGRQKNLEHRREKEEMQKQFESTLMSSRLEIAEQTMQHIAYELHDNVGHQLTLASRSIEQLETQNPTLRDASFEIIESALADLRDMSRSLSRSFILENGIELTLEKECRYISAPGKITCTFDCKGERTGLSREQELILFRCAQEALNNAMKHAEPTRLEIEMTQSPAHTTLIIADNGKGMSQDSIAGGVGTDSMQQRIELLGGTCKKESTPGRGTRITFEIPTNKREI